MAEHCDEAQILLVPPEGSFAVSLHYADFGQVDDEAVVQLLEKRGLRPTEREEGRPDGRPLE